MALLTQNSKMKKSGNRTFNFTLPALLTCPNAGECAKGCYAMQGAYRWSNVYAKHEANYNATKHESFIGAIVHEVRAMRVNAVRIHDAGDFYDKDYLMKWKLIAKALPNIKFYAYTKMVGMVTLFKRNEGLPPNFKVIYSYGGKEDNLIVPHLHRHSQVFSCEEDLLAAGYINASKNDLLALTGNKRVGLVYHGAKSKQWGK